MDGMADRMAVITGAAIGLGRTRAPACARHGVRAPLVDVDEDGLAATVALAPRCHVTKNPERHGRRALAAGEVPEIALAYVARGCSVIVPHQGCARPSRGAPMRSSAVASRRSVACRFVT